MPATYAHYTFGKEVLNRLEGDVKRMILENLDLFNIGLHGPDILFYYKPLSSNFINKIGHDIHGLSAKLFFDNAKVIIENCPNKEKACSYIIGYICHFILDSECHPIVREKESDKLSHSEIETEFERILMEKNNLKPLSFKPISHIVPNLVNSECISWFYEGLTANDILSSLKSMKLHLNILVAPGHIKRAMIISTLKLSGNYDGMIGLIMKYNSNSECVQINKELYEAYLNAIIPTSNIINEFYINLKNELPISERFNRTFG